MGRKRSSNSEDSIGESCDAETYSGASGSESPPRKMLKNYKKSHKISEAVNSGDENEILERKKHKHRHKKHKREISKHKYQYEETESYKHHKKRHSHRSSNHETKNKHRRHNEDAEKSRGHSSHRNKERYRQSEENVNRELEYAAEQQRSKWVDNEDTDSNHLRPIKTEPISDTDDGFGEQQLNNNNRKNNDRRKQREEKEKWGKKDVPMKKEENTEPKAKVNLGLSGKLAEDVNTYNGIVIKYSQPPEARKPKRRWRWYIFKGDDELPFLPLHRQSAYLIGRERKVADIPTDHPSCSKQHAVFQYRLVSYERGDGTTGRTVKPYILDLESANGTYVNNRRIDPKCYVELLEKDVVKFGYSSREYVLLHEASKGSDDEMDAGTEGPELSPISLLRSQ